MGAGGIAGALAGHVVETPTSAAAPAEVREFRLQVGQRFDRWTVSAVHPVEEGALRIDVRGEDQREFVLEILAADPSPLAPRPPAATDALAIFVRNGGDGWLPTAEEQGLAAMTLAGFLSSSGAGGPIAGLLTHSERVVQHAATLTGVGPQTAA